MSDLPTARSMLPQTYLCLWVRCRGGCLRGRAADLQAIIEAGQGEPYDACNRCCRSSPPVCCWRDAQQMTAHLTSILPNTATGITTPITRMARAGPRARRRNSTRSMALGCGRRQLVGANDGACAERATNGRTFGSVQRAQDGQSYGFVLYDAQDRASLYLGFST